MGAGAVGAEPRASVKRCWRRGKRREAKPAAQSVLRPTIASCEKGDIRQSPNGLYIYSADGREEVLLAPDISPRQVVLDEFHVAATGKRKPVHGGRWGMANLEICEAAMRSADLGTGVRLQHQVAIGA